MYLLLDVIKLIFIKFVLRCGFLEFVSGILKNSSSVRMGNNLSKGIFPQPKNSLCDDVNQHHGPQKEHVCVVRRQGSSEVILWCILTVAYFK